MQINRLEMFLSFGPFDSCELERRFQIEAVKCELVALMWRIRLFRKKLNC